MPQDVTAAIRNKKTYDAWPPKSPDVTSQSHLLTHYEI